MQNRRFSKIMLLFAAAFGATGLVARQTLEEAKLRVREGYKAPSYSTNFPSEQLLSIADIKKKTYKITSSKALRITRSATYDPTNEVTGSPMFKVQSSTVIIDLNGQVITKNVADTEIRAVAIEVGYSPEEIANLSGVDLNSQPQNVIIRNGTIDNFDMGIVVHKGVKSVRFEDLTFSRTPIGIALLGGAGADEEIVSSSFHNIKVIGGKIDDRLAIEWAKNKVEDDTWTALTHDHAETQNYGYTAATEKLVQLTDPVDGAVANAAYYGVVMRHVNNILLQNVAVDGMGYDQADNDTITVGIDVTDSNNVFLEGVTSSHNLSSRMVKGLHVKDSTSFSGMACTFNNNSAKWVSVDVTGSVGRLAHGIHFESVNASTLNGVACNKNEANNDGDTADESLAQAYGFEWATGNAIELKSIECSHNEGNKGICYGMKVDTSESLLMDDMVFDYNHGIGGDGGTTDFGATGLSLSTSAKSALMSNISVNANYGSSVAGLRVVSGESITLRNFTSDYSNGTGNIVGLSFETAIKSLACENVSVVSNTTTGADSAGNNYVKAVSCAAAQSVSFDGVRCNYNTSSANNSAVTAMEFTTSAKTVTVKGVTASNNAAHGTGAITGLVVAAGESITLDDVQFNSNTGGGASQIVNFTGSASTVSMKDIVVNSNSLTAGNFDGILMDDPVDVRMRNVSVNNNTTATNDMSGVYLKHTDNSIVNSVDMLGVTVDGNSTDVGNVYGLRVDDARNVTMANCSLSDNSQTGAPSSKVAIGLGFGTSAESITMKDIVVNNNIAKKDSTMTAISFATASALSMENVAVNNNSVVDTTAAAAVGNVYGIHFTGAAKSCGFKGLTVNYNNSTNEAGDGIAGTADGMKFDLAAENISIADSSISHTISTSNTDAAVHGLWFATSVKSLEVSNSILNSNEGAAVHGMLLTAGENVTFKNVSADQNSGTGAVLGMEFATSVQAVDMKNVTANNNSSSGSTVHGMKLTDAVAVSLDGGSVNNNNTNSAAATGVEFAVATPGTDTTDSITLRNLSVDNTLTSASGAAAIGISIDGAENLILDNVTANHTKSSHATTKGDVHGITLLSNAHSVEMDNVVMNGNSGANVWGLLVDDGRNFTMNNIAADQNSGAGTAFGIDFKVTDNDNTNAIDMNNVSCNANSAAAGVVGGLRIDAGVAVTINDISADYNQATGGESVGIEVKNSASALVLNGASASNNVSTDASATGVRVDEGNAVSMDDVSANYNNAADGQQARGIHFQASLASAHLDNLVCDSNFGGNQGVGVHIEAPSSVSMNNVSASKNDGDDRAYGCYLAGSGENVLIRGALFNGNAASDANTAMSAIDETATVSKHLPVNNYDSVTGFDTLEGGFGLYVDSIDSCQFENVEASRNQGMRAGGILVNNCNDAALRKCKTSFQHADGNFFISNPFNGVTNTAVAIPDAQAATFFGDTTATYTVDMVQTVTDYLAALRNIKYLQDTDDYDPSLPSVYTHLKNFAGSQLLLRAAIAQYRRFSTAVGVQLHNCINGVVEDHIAVGNKSDKDSAIGIGVSGTAEGHVIVRCKSAGNEAWSDSVVASNGNIVISEVLPFWTFLDTVQLTESAPTLPAAGKVDPLVGTITSAMIAYDVANANQPDMLVAVDADRLAIALNVAPASEDAFDGTFEEYGPAVGGEAIGILIGDAASSIEVSGCDCANNKGNAGKAFGIMQDVTTSMLAKDNRLYQTLANDLGYCFGLAEFTLQSNSIHLGNVMFSNAVGDHLNANFFVPFDPDDHPNIFFPVKIGYNGDIGNFANASPFDNLVVNFVAEKQVDPYLGAGIAGASNLWESSAWVEAP